MTDLNAVTRTKETKYKELLMRHYPQNSPEAAARIVALTLIADGDLSKAELNLLDALAVHEKLGLERAALHEVFDNFCADLLSGNRLTGSGDCPVDDDTLMELLDQIDAPALRRQVLNLCVRVAEADAHVADGESAVLTAAVAYWGLQHQMLQSAEVA